MKKILNPFDPNFGKLPKIYITRKTLLNEVVESLENEVGPYQTSLVYGMRGVGKTSFLTDASYVIQNKMNWIVVDLASTTDLFETLIGSIYNQADTPLQKLLNSIKGIKFSTFGFQFDVSFNQINTYQLLLEEVLKQLKKRNISLFITIDEIHTNQELVKFAAVYQVMIRKGYKINLMMAGLPKEIFELQNSNGFTFLLRSGKVVLGPLNIFDMKFRYQRAFAKGNKILSDKCAEKMAKITMGYAYAFQLLGYLVWKNTKNKVTDQVIESSLYRFKQMLFDNAYQKIYLEMSGTDRQFVNIMANSGKKEVDVSYIRQKMDKTPGYIGAYRKRLLDSQVIKSSEYGKVMFSLPFMAEYIKAIEDYY